jgi:hypothetical protein
VRGKCTVFILSGRIEGGAIAELRRLFELQTDYRGVVLDLKEVGVVDREVIRVLISCAADGVGLVDCAYIYPRMDGKRKGLSGWDAVVTFLSYARTKKQMRYTNEKNDSQQ